MSDQGAAKPKAQTTTSQGNGFEFSWFTNKELQANLASTGLLLVGVILLRFVAVRAVRRWEMPSPEHRRRWLVTIRNVALTILFFGVILIWAQELKTLALSMVAVAAALVIATKELILCFSGSFLKSSTRSFTIGDRIEVNDLRGDVIDQNLLATTILEIGPGNSSHQATGRSIVIPNSLFLSGSVVNETFMGKHVLHHIKLPMKSEDDWRGAREILLDAAREKCAPFLEDARKSFDNLAKEHSVDPPNVEPRVTLQMPEPGKIDLLLRIAVPAREKGRVEQAILGEYLDRIRSASQSASTEQEDPAAKKS